MKQIPLFLLTAAIALLIGCGKSTTSIRTQQWHPITLSFEGPSTSEDAAENPFTDYRLLVRFKHTDTEYTVRGFYAADGNAAETSADSGNVWQARFTPDRLGDWTYEASLSKGPMIAIDDDPVAGETIELANMTGSFSVVPGSPNGSIFYAHGRLLAHEGYFRFQDSDTYWLKGGADSPENFLGYKDFDGTYKHSIDFRDGESKPGEGLHAYEPHVQDWREGDPTWQNGKGKGIIGAVNYLASAGMNVAYFLTLNIDGDGKDVWPYKSHEDFTRFDCSKLDQWDILFEHMQSQGIMLHIVTQETENERLLDDGDTGELRKLYYRELIARFAHHPAITWNLGEENGPAEFSPHGQNDAQRLAMSSYLKASDPYKNPLVIHTHSVRDLKDSILTPLLKHAPLDGLSFQVDNPEHVHDDTVKWIHNSKLAGQRWLIAMDEIGPWQIGVRHDNDDPDHDLMRHQVLWGSLLGGAAGVEWYFGGHQNGNDLNTEDWRSRANMWKQTDHALSFFEKYLPFWEMESADSLTPREDDYCFAKSGEVYAIYLPTAGETQLNLGEIVGDFSIQWYSPKDGGSLQSSSVLSVSGSGIHSLGLPPSEEGDWVALVRRID